MDEQLQIFEKGEDLNTKPLYTERNLSLFSTALRKRGEGESDKDEQGVCPYWTANEVLHARPTCIEPG
jgi:hypothetical protein